MVEGPDHRRLPPCWFGGRIEGPHFCRIPQAIRQKSAAAAVTAVITSNPQDRDRIARRHAVSRRQIFVIPPGIDCRRFRYTAPGRERLRRTWGIPPGSAPFVLGTAGRLVPLKRIRCFIEALALLHARSIPAIGVIAGDGAERGSLVSLADRLGIAQAVRFIGPITGMADFYSAVDAFALCSETESFGLVIAEAMACERPVVATPTAGARQQICHLHTGWQLETFSPAELADAIAALYADPALRRRLGQQAQARVATEFNIDQTLTRTLQTLQNPRA